MWPQKPGRERQIDGEREWEGGDTEDVQAGRWREKQYQGRREEKANTGMIE